MAFVVGTGKTPVVFKRLENIADPIELRELNRMLRDIIVRLNVQQGSALVQTGSLVFEAFIGTGAKTNFDLAGLVKAGTSPQVTVQGTLQKPDTSFTVQNLNDIQDQIHFLWTPQLNRIIMVWYQPA